MGDTRVPLGGGGRQDGGRGRRGGGGGLGGALCTVAEGEEYGHPPWAVSSERRDVLHPPLCTPVLCGRIGPPPLCPSAQGGGHGGCCASAAIPRPVTSCGAMGVLQVPRPVRFGHRAEGRSSARVHPGHRAKGLGRVPRPLRSRHKAEGRLPARCALLRRPKLPTPPPNVPPKKMSQMMVIKNAFYRDEILATSKARLFPLVFDYPHIRFWHVANNTNLRLGPAKYGENSQIVRRNPTECMCVSARFNLTTPAEALLVDAYHFHQNLFCRQ